MFITFIYKIDSKIYFGKYVTDYISPDHNGLDNIIMPLLQRGLNNVDIKIGILSLSDVIHLPFTPSYATDNEIHTFDFYCKMENFAISIYINGELVISESDLA